jgi:AcrR family transcriptional regulator
MTGSEGKRGSPGQKARKSEQGAPKGASESSGSVHTKPSARKRKKSAAANGIVPLYTRLPKGPHKIGATEVAHHQRIRMHGAMIEAIDSRGYEKTSVMLVIGLAGVSRRAFYEQFSGKEACFLETFDLIVKREIQRLTHAYRTTSGDREKRMRGAIDILMGELEQNPKPLRLVLVDAQHAGLEGPKRLHRTTAMCEGLFSSAFSDKRHPDALPAPVVRAIVGGLRRTAFMRLRDRETEDLAPLGREMLKWLSAFRSTAVRGLRPRPCDNAPFASPIELDAAACGGEGRRARLLRSAIEIGVREQKYDEVSSLRIADNANLPIETFMELYRSPEACYMEALDVLGDELLQLVADPGLVSEEWPAAVCATVETLLAHLAASPARLMTFAGKALQAGPVPNANMVDLAYEVATLLTEGAPRRPRCRIAVEGIAGGLWHILNGEMLAGRGHRLPVLCEYISYVVLAPFLGPEEAARAVVHSRGGHAGAAHTNGTGSPNGVAHLTPTLAGAPPAVAMNGALTARRGTPEAKTNGSLPDAEAQSITANGTSPHGAQNVPGGSSRAPEETNGIPAGASHREGASHRGPEEANGAGVVEEEEEEDYRRLEERRSAKCVNTTPTSTETTITTISGA